MLGVNQLDFLNYTTAFKCNYRKGVHKLRSILSTTVQAEEFARNKGGVAVVLGVPIDAPDKNSDDLLTLLLESNVVDIAAETFLSCFYEFSDLNILLSNKATCNKIVVDALQWRTASISKVVVGKIVATLAGFNCANYADIGAVIANTSAMNTVIANSSAMSVLIASSTAMAAVTASTTAMTEVAASSTAMGAIVENSAALDAVIASSTAMSVVTASSTAMSAVAASSVAMGTIVADSSAMDTVTASSIAMTALSSNAFALNFICKNISAKAAFNKSVHNANCVNQITASLANATYFTPVNTNISSTTVNAVVNDYLYNATSCQNSSQQGNTIDMSIIIIQTIKVVASGYACSAVETSGKTTILSTNSTGYTSFNKTIMGGFYAKNLSYTGKCFTAK